ncbi:hypothetical protein VPNG_08935 [Cytospora leucostoma]|uniref:Uncharacterized protein n=1 Tax=Cytospora leucostoma TaxID=1230097 RepID=A0A423VWQ4_9PEZI|nr:hypothetical protein VPNG_08935 [Cytospora leucostoma]
MQLTETVTIINKSGKVISNGRHIVSIFKEAKAAYQDRKAAIKAERAAESEARPSIRKTQTYAGYEDNQAYDVPGRARILEYGRGKGHAHEPRYLDQGDRRRSNDDAQSHASSRRSHGSHRSKRSRDKSGRSSRPPLTENNLRTLSEVSDMTPSQAPRAYRSPGGEAIPSRPSLVHATTAPATVDLQGGSVEVQGTNINRAASQSVRNPDVVDMNLAYGDVPPDLASRTDLGPDTQVDVEPEIVVEGEANKEAQARTIMERIEALLDEAECVHHTATSIIDHLQRKPEAAAAVALLLAELSTLLKAISPGFLGVVKGGFPVIFALLASPQFLIGVGVAVGVTVVCFGGWKIVKHIREAKAAGAREKAAAFEMQGGQQPATAMPYNPDAAGSQPAASDDALVLEEELGSIEAWRRGIAPGDDEDGDGVAGSVVESADLELITPQAARSARDDGRSIRTTRTHRSSRSHRGHHKSRRHEDGGDADDAVLRRNSRSKAAAAAAAAADAESVADSERSRRTSRSKTTSRTSTRAITVGGERDGTAVDMVLRPKDKKPNMLKTLFMKKKDRDDGRDTAVSVMA